MNSITTLVFVCSLFVYVYDFSCLNFIRLKWGKGLEVYNYGDKSLKNLYCKVSKLEFKTNDEAMANLTKEVNDSMDESMQKPFACLKDSKMYCVYPLLNAECIAVFMYTTRFYENYNTAFRNGNLEKYIIYTSLLHSAVKKLSQYVNGNVTVYRGVDKDFNYQKKPFHFKQFTSTSFDEAVAKEFSDYDRKMLKITFQHKSLIAKLANFSRTPLEKEILISPFQAIQFYKKENEYVLFQSHEHSYFKCK